jgi:hypothetical protein
MFMDCSLPFFAPYDLPSKDMETEVYKTVILQVGLYGRETPLWV